MENQNDQALVTRKTFLMGGQRAGYLFASLLGGAGCAILAPLCSMDAPYRSDYTKLALIGLSIRIALSVIGYIAMLPLLALPYQSDAIESHRYGTSGKTGDAGEKSGATKRCAATLGVDQT